MTEQKAEAAVTCFSQAETAQWAEVCVSYMIPKKK